MRNLRTAGPLGAAYTWDALGHLTSVVSEDTTITYAYGITGMREYKSVEASGAPVAWTKSVWDGQQLVAELDSDGVGYTYVWGPDRTPLALKVTSGASSVTYAYHTDALGNVMAITSPAGEVVASYRYDPYGRVTHVGGSDAALAERNPIRYRSYYHDAETGFYYLPARYYDPDTMRFLSADPAAPSAGDPLSLNRYTYCVGDPVDCSDPTGAVMVAGGGGGFDHHDIDSGTLAVQLIAHGWSKSKAYAFNAKQKETTRHKIWRIRSDVAYRQWQRDLRADCDLAAAANDALRALRSTRKSPKITSFADDPTGIAYASAGTTLDLLTLASGESGVGPVIFGVLGAAVGIANVGRHAFRWFEGKSTAGDVGMAIVGVVPIVGMAKEIQATARYAEALDNIGHVARGITYTSYATSW